MPLERAGPKLGQRWLDMASIAQHRRINVALLLGFVLAVGFAAYLVMHWSYYRLPRTERLLDSRHAVLRSSGSSGLVFGVAGTVAMLLNLTYLVRKRLSAIAWLGSLRSWMRFHVLTGLLGPALVLLHSAFAPSSALGGLALTAMIIVVMTGLLGRYIYTHVPRSYRGRELELSEVRRRLVEYREALETLGVESAGLKLDSGPSGPESEVGTGLFAALRSLLAGDREARRQFRQLQVRLVSPHVDQAQAREILALLRQLCRERQWLLRYHELRGLMGSWRFFHRWLAVVMFLVVGFHIILALRFGDLWLFQRG